MAMNLVFIGKNAMKLPLLANSTRNFLHSYSKSKLLVNPTNSMLFYNQTSNFGTSKKQDDAGTISTPQSSVTQADSDVDHSNVTGKKKYWVSKGFSEESKEEDDNWANFAMFCTITVLTCSIAMFYAYLPDFKLKDWAQREAYIQIAKREALGLPHIDPDIVPPENVNLPTEEELGDYDIII